MSRPKLVDKRVRSPKIVGLLEDLRAFVANLPSSEWYATSYDERAGTLPRKRPWVFLRASVSEHSIALVFGLRKDKSRFTIDTLTDETKVRITQAYEAIRSHQR